jgi:hypothetical protein
MHPFNRSQEMLSAYVVPPRVSFICLLCCAVAWRFGVSRAEGRLGHEPGRSRSVLASASVSSVDNDDGTGENAGARGSVLSDSRSWPIDPVDATSMPAEVELRTAEVQAAKKQNTL